MSDFPAAISLSDLDGTNGFRIAGAAANALSGFSVSSGDINGDGFSDVIIGAPGDTFNGPDSGATYVVFGTAGPHGSEVDLASLHRTDGFKLLGGVGQATGFSIAGADFNGDGFDDVLVAAPRAFPLSSNGYDSSGAVYIVNGHPGPSAFTIARLPHLTGGQVTTFKTDNAYNSVGSGVTSAGDVNGDGFDDFMTAGTDSFPPDFRQHLFLILGGEGTAQPHKSQITEASRSITAAAGGDINGDGFDDIVVSRTFSDFYGYKSGSVAVVFGNADGSLVTASRDGSNGFYVATGPYSAVSGAGDVNGDGFDDIIVDGNVIFGKAAAFAKDFDLATLDGTNGFGVSPAASFVSAAGDVNGDGFDDILLGRVGPNGRACVLFGKPGGFSASLDLSTLDGDNGFAIGGKGANPLDASAMSAAGDVNGDGFDDIIIGISKADVGGTDSGASYVVFGRGPNGPAHRVGSTAGQEIVGGRFNDTIDGLGGADTVRGGFGADHLSGGAGADSILGSFGNDTLNGGLAADTLIGGKGDDTYEAVQPGDTLYEAQGGGLDTIRSAHSARLAANFENLVLTGRTAATGSGNDAANFISGNAAANGIFGGNGNDVLRGAAGDDTIGGGDGRDTIAGGDGRDRILFAGPLDATNIDRINDFSATDDTIALSHLTFAGTGTTTGTLAFVRFHVGAAAHDANDRIIYDGATGALLYDADGTGEAAAIRFANLAAHLALANQDFLVF